MYNFIVPTKYKFLISTNIKRASTTCFGTIFREKMMPISWKSNAIAKLLFVGPLVRSGFVFALMMVRKHRNILEKLS